MSDTLFTWTPPPSDRATAIETVAAHAEENCPGWKQLAGDLVQRYASMHREFVSEDCTDWAYENGLPHPHDARALGQIYRNEAKAGTIVKVKDRSGWSRKRASPTTLWRSCHPNFAEAS